MMFADLSKIGSICISYGLSLDLVGFGGLAMMYCLILCDETGKENVV